MKKHLKRFANKINFWNLFIGIVIGFGMGIWVINALVPDANGMIKYYHIDKASMDAERAARGK